MAGTRFKALLLAGLCIATTPSATAHAEDDAAKARTLAKQGLADFNNRRYAEAIQAFLASYAISPIAVLIFDTAQAYRLLGQCDEALQLYRRYLREAPDARNRSAVAARIVE